MARSRRSRRRSRRSRVVPEATDASTNASAAGDSVARLSPSRAQSRAIASWLPRHSAASSLSASAQARAPSAIRRLARSASAFSSIQARSRGQAVSSASWVN